MFNSWLTNDLIITSGLSSVLIFVIAVVVLVLKGFALWYSVKRDQKWWFIALLIINTVGILEIIYLLFIVKKWPNSWTESSSSGTTDVTARPTEDTNQNTNNNASNN